MPIVSFLIFFFFLNHLIESTIISLELVFEHRNYLPSLFLFFPVSVGFKWMFDYYHEKKSNIYFLMVSFAIILLIGTGLGTYSRNLAWATEKSFWEDAMKKAPGNARPYHNLANYYYAKIGCFDKALKLYEKALPLKYPNPNYDLAVSLKNMGSIYLKKNEYEKAIKHTQKALFIFPEYNDARYDLVLMLVKTGKWKEALENADRLLARQNNNAAYLDLNGFVLLKQKKYNEAISFFRAALNIKPNYRRSLLNMGVTLSLTGEYGRGYLCLRRADQIFPNEITTLFCLIENRLRAGDTKNVDQYIGRLFASYSIEKISTTLKEIICSNFLVPVAHEVIAPVIAKKIMERFEETVELKINNS